MKTFRVTLGIALLLLTPLAASAQGTTTDAAQKPSPLKPATAKPQTTKPQPTKPHATTPQTAKPRTTKPASAKAATPVKPPQQLGVTTASGLTYVITHRGDGRRPKTGDTVLVHYTGTLTDGTKFDSSHDAGEPIAFPLGRSQVIKGWDEGIAQLGVGDRAVLIVPPDLGYGARGAGGVIPPNATLVFVVTLVDVKGEAVSQVLLKTLDEKGVEAAVAQYRALKARGLDGLFTNEGDLNMLGYRLLRQKKIGEAVEILKLNVDAYPQSGNVYDSLAEAYLMSGETALAVENYEKSVALDPKNSNALEMLKKLKGKQVDK